MPAYSDRVPDITPPTHIKHDDLIEALEPLFTLCGVTANEVYWEGFTISGDGVKFTVAARATDADKRPSGDDENAEWVRDVVIPTDIGLVSRG